MTPILHRSQVRVYWEDTDAGGIVYHSNYLNFAERGRTEFLRSFGVAQSDLAHGGYAFAVADIAVKFKKPAKLDNLLEVETLLTAVNGAAVCFDQCIKRVDDGAELVRLDVRVAYIDLHTGRPARLPADLKALLQGQIQER